MLRTVKYFVSYARKNKRLADALLEHLSDMCAPSKSYTYRPWSDTAVLPGEDWDREIQQALADCDFGLLLVSPEFLGPEYITRDELHKFVGRGKKPCIPVMLKPIDFARHNLKGLEARQIFRLDSPTMPQPRAFSECTSRQRDRFVLKLFEQTEDRLKKLL